MCTDSYEVEWEKNGSKSINKEKHKWSFFYYVLEQQLVAPCWELVILLFMVILTEILEATFEAKYSIPIEEKFNESVLISSQ